MFEHFNINKKNTMNIEKNNIKPKRTVNQRIANLRTKIDNRKTKKIKLDQEIRELKVELSTLAKQEVEKFASSIGMPGSFIFAENSANKPSDSAEKRAIVYVAKNNGRKNSEDLATQLQITRGAVTRMIARCPHLHIGTDGFVRYES